MSHYHNADGKPPKSGELPNGKSIDDIDESVRPIIIDRHLTREHLITRIIDATGIDRERGTNQDLLNHVEMVRLYRDCTDDDRDEATILHDMDKEDVKEAIADAYGVDADMDMGKAKFGKMGLISLLVAIQTDGGQPRTALLENPGDSDPVPHRSTNDI